MDVQRFKTWIPQSIGGCMLDMAVPAIDFDRVTAERDALQQLLNARDEEVGSLLVQLAAKQTMSDNYCALLMDANAKLAARPEDAEREDFEKWYAEDVGPSANLSREMSGAYRYEDAMSAWSGWMARAKLENQA